MIFYLPQSYEVGTIDFLELIYEQNIDSPKLFPTFKNSFKGKCVIEVYGREGNSIPHFHITSTDNLFSCCICLFENKFFVHGKHRDTLNKKDWKVLDTWLRQTNSKDNTKTNWEYAKFIWIQQNSDNYRLNRKTINDYEQPDYTIIKPYKEK